MSQNFSRHLEENGLIFSLYVSNGSFLHVDISQPIKKKIKSSTKSLKLFLDLVLIRASHP